MLKIKYLIVALFLSVGHMAYTQKLQHEFSVPLLNFQMTNLGEFKSELNKHYWNHFYLPNFRYSVQYKKYFIGLEHYYDERFSGNATPKLGMITNLKLQSYSLLLGLKWFDLNNLRIKSGLGYTYFDSWVGLYINSYPRPWESTVCYEYNPHSMLFWTTASYEVNKSFSCGLNLRFNPMFQAYKDYDDKYSQCETEHDHDRLQLLVAQLTLAYKF